MSLAKDTSWTKECEDQHTEQGLGDDGQTGLEARAVYVLEVPPFPMTQTAHCSYPNGWSWSGR